MIYDLQGEESMSPIVGILYSAVKENSHRLLLITDGMIQGKSLIELMSDYAVILAMLKDTCTQLKDEELNKVVTFGHENEKQATIRWGLWHMADHSRYHQAHINQLRKWYKENSLEK